MGLRFRSLTGVLVLVAAAIFHSAVMAQPDPDADIIGDGTPAEAVNQAYYTNDPNFFRNRAIDRQLSVILGQGSLLRSSYPENEITRDSLLIDLVYRDLIDQQGSSDPIIRTPDLPNPFGTSVLLSPRLNANNRASGGEFVFETLPPR